MTKTQAITHIQALYAVFNAADSDSDRRESWTRPEMAATCCNPLDAILRQILSTEELEALYANGEIG
jgi:hypothetical protein